MDTRRILADLRSERDRIDRAIAAMESLDNAGVQTVRRRGRAVGVPGAPAGQRRRRRGPMSAASRKRLSELMKQRWAERKKKAAKA